MALIAKPIIILATLVAAMIFDIANPTSCNPIGMLPVQLSHVIRPLAGHPAIFKTFYQVEVNLGLPERKFSAAFDISTSDTIVPTTNATDHISFENDGIYISRKSETSRCVVSYYTTEYRGQRLAGSVYKERLSLKSTNNQSNSVNPFYLMATDERKEFLDACDWKAYLIIGLGPNENNRDGRRGFVTSLMAAGHINSLQFSISFKDKNQAGQILFGGTDRRLYEGDLSLHKIVSTNEWALNLKPVLLGSEVVGCTASCKAILSTMTSDIRGPTEQVSKIYNLLGVVINNGLATLPSATSIVDLPTLTFVIDGKQYSYPPELYTNRAEGVTYLGIVQDHSLKNDWILGTDFLSKYYTAYDFPGQTVGIAPALVR